MISKGFTYAEVLLGIVLLLTVSAVAVPNFADADIRAKVSRARNNLRTVQTALEAYKIDRGKYIWCNGRNWAFASQSGTPGASNNTPTLERLTTPIAYVGEPGVFRDPFKPTRFYEGSVLQTLTNLQDHPDNQNIWYTARNYQDTSIWGQKEAYDIDPVHYHLQSSGPDRAFDFTYQMLNQMTTDNLINRVRSGQAIYDPTNGIASRGSLWRVGGEDAGSGISLFRSVKNDEDARKER